MTELERARDAHSRGYRAPGRPARGEEPGMVIAMRIPPKTVVELNEGGFTVRGAAEELHRILQLVRFGKVDEARARFENILLRRIA